MTGTITDARPHINLLIKGESIQAIAEFTIDTGYSGTLTLPLVECLALGLPFLGKRKSYLADGTQVRLNVYRLTVEWNGKERDFEIFAIGEERLLGVQLLQGYKLCLDFFTNTLTVEDAQRLRRVENENA